MTHKPDNLREHGYVDDGYMLIVKVNDAIKVFGSGEKVKKILLHRGVQIPYHPIHAHFISGGCIVPKGMLFCYRARTSYAFHYAGQEVVNIDEIVTGRIMTDNSKLTDQWVKGRFNYAKPFVLSEGEQVPNNERLTIRQFWYAYLCLVAAVILFFTLPLNEWLMVVSAAFE